VKTCPATTSSIATIRPIPRGKVAWTNRHVYVERNRRIERVADRPFEGEKEVLHVIERIVAPLGLRVDATSPWSTRDFRMGT
jgi:Flp pilus assembly CpaF family ATPase